MLGTVEKLYPDKGFGFIRDEGGKERFFHFSNVRGVRPEQGDTVVFEHHRDSKRRIAATAVRQIVLPNAKRVFEEVAQWKLDAKLEDPGRYFYQPADLTRLETGTKCFVIGRKGTGKTAISEFLTGRRASKLFSKKLTFKNFPFRDLYDLANDRYTAPNQYITLWKYLIYSSVVQLMTQDQSVDGALRESLSKVFGHDPLETLSNSIRRWTSRSFEVKIAGTGISVGAVQGQPSTSWLDKVDLLEQLILRTVNDTQYLVVFDELDEDYKYALDVTASSQYKALITSLFKAVQDVKAAFRARSSTVLPLLFLRDDIFAQIRDPDRTKWTDLSLALEWDNDEIKQLLAFRISRALNATAEAMPFDEAWAHLFDPRPITQGHEGAIQSSFSFISRSSMRRPRDFVKCLQVCAELAHTRSASRITGDIVRGADKEYSSYLRSDLEDELGSLLPEASEIFAMLAALGRQIFSFDEFAGKYRSWVDASRLPNRDPQEVVSALHGVSAIGTHAKNDRHLFRYANRDLRPDLSRPFCVHRGLYRSLSLI